MMADILRDLRMRSYVYREAHARGIEHGATQCALGFTRDMMRAADEIERLRIRVAKLELMLHG